MPGASTSTTLLESLDQVMPRLAVIPVPSHDTCPSAVTSLAESRAPSLSGWIVETRSALASGETTATCDSPVNAFRNVRTTRSGSPGFHATRRASSPRRSTTSGFGAPRSGSLVSGRSVSRRVDDDWGRGVVGEGSDADGESEAAEIAMPAVASAVGGCSAGGHTARAIATPTRAKLAESAIHARRRPLRPPATGPSGTSNEASPRSAGSRSAASRSRSIAIPQLSSSRSRAAIPRATSPKLVVSGDNPSRIESGARKSGMTLASMSPAVSRRASGWRTATWAPR